MRFKDIFLLSENAAQDHTYSWMEPNGNILPVPKGLNHGVYGQEILANLS